MLGQPVFYNNLIKTYITYFGQIFNNISIIRNDPQSGNTVQINVPVEYAPRQKALVRQQDFSDLNRRDVAIVVPMITYSILTLDYDHNRMTPSMNKQYSTVDSNGNTNYIYTPVPYNVTFDLNIIVENQEDGLMIIEQILPFFTPEFTSSLLLPPFGTPIDIPVSLVAISLRDTYEGAPADLRYIIWSLSFILKGQLARGVSPAGVITNIDINMYNSMSSNYNILSVNYLSNTNTIERGTLVYEAGQYTNVAAGYVYSSNSTSIVVEQTTGTFQNYTNTNNYQLYINNTPIAIVTNTQAANVVNEVININGTQANNIITTITENY
jgi:hypothetical protein